jgi:hypothetical protein
MRYRPNRAFEAEIQATPKFHGAMVATAGAATAAIKIAAQPYRNTGYFIRHIERRGTTIRLTDPFWHLSEFGSIHNPPQRNVLRGIRAIGLRYDDAHKPG